MSKIDDIRSLGAPGIGRQLNPRGSGEKRPAASQRAAGPSRASELVKASPKDGELDLPTRLAVAGKARAAGMENPARVEGTWRKAMGSIPGTKLRGTGGSTMETSTATKSSPLKCPVCEARRIAHRLRAAKSRAKKEARPK
jgi:hypothetical protein